MGFFEKVKNMFTEEVEEDEVKVEQIKQDVTRVAIESPVTEKIDDTFIDNFEFKNEEKINAPVFFDDSDFRDLNLSKPLKEEKVPEKEIYPKKAEVEKKVFKPTPIISPVYGILDKNYHKEDIVSRNEVKKDEKEITESSIDFVRNKAYGTLEDELENTLFGSNSILFKKDEPEEELEIKEVDDDILTNLTDDISRELDELLIKKEKFMDDMHEPKDDDSEVENSNISDDDLLDFIDSTLYKEGDE